MDSKKDTAVSFLRLAASGRTHEAFERYASPGFVHHNAYFPADAQSLSTAMDENARQNPGKHLDVKHTLEDGNLVAVHSYVKQRPDDRGAALVHLFRFEGERVAELWDVAQPVPAEMVNANGMF